MTRLAMSPRERGLVLIGIRLGMGISAGIASHAANRGDGAAFIGKWLETIAEDDTLLHRMFDEALNRRVPVREDLMKAHVMQLVRGYVEAVPDALDRITRSRS
jgi:hypothetical protein